MKLELDGGTLRAGLLWVGPLFHDSGDESRNELAISHPTAELVIDRALNGSPAAGYAAFHRNSQLSAVPGSHIRMRDTRFLLESDEPENFADLINLTLTFEGSPEDGKHMEVMGLDVGPVDAGFDLNFALGTLELGGEGFGWVKLDDWADNHPDSEVAEALYVDTLILHAESILELNGFNLYYRHLVDEGGTVIGAGGAMVLVPEPGGAGWILAGLMGLAWRGRGSRVV